MNFLICHPRTSDNVTRQIEGVLFLTIPDPFKERESLNSNIVQSVNRDEWGVRCLRYKIKDLQLPPRVKESMQMQAERRKGGAALESEGKRPSTSRQSPRFRGREGRAEKQSSWP